ncbi:pentatricopeptide repeat-containing protein At1g34160 isoform X2 [Benincasa hispida]|uniref:pentatricopeptide repeat-containing protein At1g34160 isoform X2 n=1 Tax=Benincasa hispida TaxID=102211 RepID=UPI001902912D|nr:pentatricopeptide repeat-containing protein At1g34160 isoform X2 [Benincasa hispida]XP_038885015.1 pentatricopeptide repeat-containing protein At1g34160 isoform X2 [Benincasa hispida]XP_038885016.1 pentatricopeptide repeat-containing protein At1g34160 isoform X2 [Benincasa hispida]
MAYFNLLLQKCSSFSQIKQLQANLIINGDFQFSSSRTKLLELCAISSFGDLSYAIHIFRYIRYPSTNDWNAVIRGTALSSDPANAVFCYRAMAASNGPHRIDALTCSFALKACARALARSEAMQLHSQLLRFGFNADVLLQTTLLDAYAKVGDLDLAQKLFDEMPQPDIASWNALIAGFAQGSRPGDAIMLFKRMKENGNLRPNEVTVQGALLACSQLGALKEGENVHKYIVEEKLDMNVQVCNVVIDMYAKCGSVDKAYWVFENMRCEKSLITWNTMIMAFAMHGDGYKASDLFEKMVRSGMSPDAVSYLSVLCACNHAGLVEDGLKLFDSMVQRGLAPNIKHYGAMVDLLGRAGRLKEAYEIVNSMPFPNMVLWQTLLGACRTYGNVEMAELASRKLVEMGFISCGDFVLLSNVYATRQRWDDVGRVRDAMRRRDVKKTPGFSYIEVKGKMHKFVYGDQSHLSHREIYAKLDEIKFRIKAYGYAAETGNVLHDIGDEDKENALCYHSEKLAVAFGLTCTEEGTPIQVIKNLRICGDCHVVIKLISQIYNREIVVRDRTRFHRFKEGLCSCKDYW